MNDKSTGITARKNLTWFFSGISYEVHKSRIYTDKLLGKLMNDDTTGSGDINEICLDINAICSED